MVVLHINTLNIQSEKKRVSFYWFWICISLLSLLLLVLQNKENRSTGSIFSKPATVSHTFYHVPEEAVLLFYTIPVAPQYFKQFCEMQFLPFPLLSFPRTLEKILSPKGWIKIFTSSTAEVSGSCHLVCTTSYSVWDRSQIDFPNLTSKQVLEAAVSAVAPLMSEP